MERSGSAPRYPSPSPRLAPVARPQSERFSPRGLQAGVSPRAGGGGGAGGIPAPYLDRNPPAAAAAALAAGGAWLSPHRSGGLPPLPPARRMGEQHRSEGGCAGPSEIPAPPRGPFTESGCPPRPPAASFPSSALGLLSSLSTFNSAHPPPSARTSLSHCLLGGLSWLRAPSTRPPTFPFCSLESPSFHHQFRRLRSISLALLSTDNCSLQGLKGFPFSRTP